VSEPALFRHLPALAARVPWQPLGVWPTPVTAAEVAGRTLWVKHEGASHPTYGGNKLRTLEAWFGHARATGARTIWAIGAYGSNHAIATVLHAPAAGLAAGAIVFPQPPSPWARENAGALIATGCPIVCLRSVLELPFAAAWVALRTPDALVMPPGGATPIGTLGAASAAFELAEQVAAGVLPAPRRIVVAAGSTCTAAGLLAGLQLARVSGAWRWPVPRVHAVRVTPWPVTSRAAIVQLAARTLARVAALGGPVVAHGLGRLLAMLTVDGREIGEGYGQPTARGEAAAAALVMTGARLDGVYAAKAAAALLRLHARDEGPLLLWATKSDATLAAPSAAALRAGPPALVRWLARAA